VEGVRFSWFVGVILGMIGPLGGSGSAHAEYWASPAGELLRAATRVEIVRIDRVNQGRVRATVIESERGKSVGGADPV